jgi:hypothetical protein
MVSYRPSSGNLVALPSQPRVVPLIAEDVAYLVALTLGKTVYL